MTTKARMPTPNKNGFMGTLQGENYEKKLLLIN
jgi:hypothetical protein